MVHNNTGFDIVLFKSMLGGIGKNNQKEQQARTVREIYKSLKPGGELFFAENLVASPLHTYARKRFMKREKTWRYVSIAEMHSFLSDFACVDTAVTGCTGCFGRSDLQQRILGNVDRYCMNFLTPKKWKYIMIGVAKK